MRIAAHEVEIYQIWTEAFDLWLRSLRSPNTRRAYRQNWGYFNAFAQLPPWKVTRSDVARWVEHMRAHGLSDCTRSQRLATVSSFYTYTCSDFTVMRDGEEVPLHGSNPAISKSLRPKISPYGKAIHLTKTQARALLDAIPRDTAGGLRDYALFLAYLMTGRRNSEIRNLRWGDVDAAGAQSWYTWSGKGKVNQKAELPGPVLEAVRAWLCAGGRNDLRAGEYIFTSLSTREKPISMREVGRLLKVYCRRAGLDAKKIHVHTLRHTAAMLRREAGEDIESISQFLGHNNIGTTQIYLHRLEGQADRHWHAVGGLLGL